MSAGNCVCVGIGVVVGAIIGVGIYDAADVSVGGGVGIIGVSSLLSATVSGLGVGVVSAITVALMFTLPQEPCWRLCFTE